MKKILFIIILLSACFAVQNNTEAKSVINTKNVTIIINKEDKKNNDKKIKKCRLNYLTPIEPYMDNY